MSRVIPWLIILPFSLLLAQLPNDPLYGNRGNLRAAGFEEAWQLATGGCTADDTEIVIAILDDGFDTDHEDLRENLWTNPREIPGDGLDNDWNGYVDDVHGWDFTNQSGQFQASIHGTQTAGIIGASGNNEVGSTGGNWKASLMLFTTLNVDDIIAAYTYIIEQRKLYKDTNGRLGAFIVATNLSYGIGGARCEDHPEWAGIYDRLGALGILSVVGVENLRADADLRRDMPADCPSPYLVSVTNVDADNRLHRSAAYGRLTVDVAAPGEGSLSTWPDNRYGGFGGTSAAAPYVTAAVALLAASPCDRLASALKLSPAATALLIKDAILTTARTSQTLAQKTVSGGSLDVRAAQLHLMDSYCQDSHR